MSLRISCLSLLAAASLSAQSSRPPLIVSATWLAQHVNDADVVVLFVDHDPATYAAGHIPGARELSYMDITTSRDSIGTELPDPDALRRAFERVGVSDNSHVVIYTDTAVAPMASRAFLSLDYLGHARTSLLNGGLAAWRATGNSVSTETPAPVAGHLTPAPHVVTVDASWIMAHTGKPGVAFIDTRTTPEYLGTGSRGGLPSAGHIAGARQLEWQQLFADASAGQFLDSAAIASLYKERSAPGDTLVTYCLVGYRASMTYFAARMLGLPVKIYDGSYQDWARRQLPVVKGPNP
jgi:thiosulfate/3-mercaptopyruvate sulfurtransferase